MSSLPTLNVELFSAASALFFHVPSVPTTLMDADWVSPASTKDGYLPPWEVAKVFAFKTVLSDVSDLFLLQPHEIVGKRVDEYIAEKVTLKGGGHPTARAVRKLLRKSHDHGWFPGKEPDDVGGRPLIYNDHQRNAGQPAGLFVRSSVCLFVCSFVR